MSSVETTASIRGMGGAGRCDKRYDKLRRSFCGETQSAVKKLNTGPSVYIVMSALIFAVKSSLTTTRNTPEAQRWNSSKNHV
jgi:hypothetical protein